MRTAIREYRVYTFAELSESAKEKVRQWYLEGQEAYIFQDDCEMWLGELFPNSELKVQFDLGYSQGDGLNVYGIMNLHDMYKQIQEKKPELFTEKERKALEWYLKEYGTDVKLKENWRYSYCIADSYDFTENIIDDMEYGCIRDINYAALEKFNEAARDVLGDICGDLEKSGYEYFYEVDDDTLAEWAEINQYEFEEDGTIF